MMEYHGIQSIVSYFYITQTSKINLFILLWAFLYTVSVDPTY